MRHDISTGLAIYVRKFDIRTSSMLPMINGSMVTSICLFSDDFNIAVGINTRDEN